MCSSFGWHIVFQMSRFTGLCVSPLVGCYGPKRLTVSFVLVDFFVVVFICRLLFLFICVTAEVNDNILKFQKCQITKVREKTRNVMPPVINYHFSFG